MLPPLTSGTRVPPLKINKTTKGKEEILLSLFAKNMIIYVDNLKESTKHLLELMHKFSKVVGL